MLSGSFGDFQCQWRREELPEEGAQKPREPAQQQREVVARGGEDGIGTLLPIDRVVGG
jgi:hypothetical protein